MTCLQNSVSLGRTEKTTKIQLLQVYNMGSKDRVTEMLGHVYTEVSWTFLEPYQWTQWWGCAVLNSTIFWFPIDEIFFYLEFSSFSRTPKKKANLSMQSCIVGPQYPKREEMVVKIQSKRADKNQGFFQSILFKASLEYFYIYSIIYPIIYIP